MKTFEINQERKDELDQCVKALLEAIPKTKSIRLLGEANELWLFIASVPRKK